MTDIKVFSDTVTQIRATDNGPQININMTRDRPRTLPVYTEGDVTITPADFVAGRYFISTDAVPVNYFFPPGLPTGVIEIFQGGTGQITLVPSNGASFADEALRSAGQYSGQLKMQVYSFGDGTFMVYGDSVVGVLEWSIVGQTDVKEGDTCTYVIWRPDSTAAFPSGVTLQVTGSNFDTAGFDQTLVQALTNLAKLDSGVTFDGVDTLTIKPSARNPLPLQFFPKPTYTTIGDRSVGITIANPSDGAVSPLAAAVNTTIRNVSRPWTPQEIIAAYTVAKLTTAASNAGTNTLTLADVTDVKQYGTVVATGVPAQTYVTAINGKTITLSNNLTQSVGIGASVTIKPPGFFLDFTASDVMTLDGSNNCTTVNERINGYPFTAPNSTLRPVYAPNYRNGKGAMNFNPPTGSARYLLASSPAIAAIADAPRQRSTLIIVGEVDSALTTTGNWFDGAFTLQANISSGAFSQSLTSTTIKEVDFNSSLNEPYVWTYKNDGTTTGAEVFCNGQRGFVPATVSVDAASGQKVVIVDDTSSIRVDMCCISLPYGGLKSTIPTAIGAIAGNQFKVQTVDSATQLTLNQNLVETLVAGQQLLFFSQIGFNQPSSTQKTTASYAVGASSTGTNGIKAKMHYVIFFPWILSVQEWRGLHLWINSQIGTTFTKTTANSASAGAKTIPLSDVSGVKLYQLVSGTGIKPGSTVVKINTTTNVITLDEKLTGAVGNGDTITFSRCAVKLPDLLDISSFTPLHRDDFVNGPTLIANGKGMRPYSGDPNSPGTFNGAYGALGHGSSNNGTVGKAWYLDVLNWAPWRKYNPFSVFKSKDTPKGALKITASPTASEIANLVGYSPPQASAYPYTSGFLRDAGAVNHQYAYWETRCRQDAVVGAWGAFWLLASHGGYPPEIDIWEGYGKFTATLAIANHYRRKFDSVGGTDFTARAVSPSGGDILTDFDREYMIVGAEVTPDAINFYLNREFYFSIPTQWCTHTHWYWQFNLMVDNNQTPDLVTPMSVIFDYAGIWRRPDQTVSLTGATQVEKTALVAAMSVAPDSTRQTLINTTIEKLKLYKTSFGDSLWSRLDFLVMCWAHDAQAARINWKDPAQIGTVVGSPTFTVDRGYAGVLNSAYIDMGGVLSAQSGWLLNSTLNQCSIGCYAANITRTDAVAVGTGKFQLTPRSGNTMNTTLWTTAAFTAATASTNGHYAATRNHLGVTFYHNSELANGGVLTGKPTATNDTRSTDAISLKIANGTSRVGYAYGGDYLTHDDIRYLTKILDDYGRAVGAIT